MLGIIGGHLLLMKYNYDSEWDLGRFSTLVSKLHMSIGTSHPDVAALALQCPDPELQSTVTTLSGPPMLQQSWKLLVEVAQKRPELISVSMWKQVQALTPTALPPFLVWTIDDDIKLATRKEWARAMLNDSKILTSLFKGKLRESILLDLMQESANDLSMDDIKEAVREALATWLQESNQTLPIDKIRETIRHMLEHSIQQPEHHLPIDRVKETIQSALSTWVKKPQHKSYLNEIKATANHLLSNRKQQSTGTSLDIISSLQPQLRSFYPDPTMVDTTKTIPMPQCSSAPDTVQPITSSSMRAWAARMGLPPSALEVLYAVLN